MLCSYKYYQAAAIDTCQSDETCQCDPGWLGKYCRFEEALCDEIIFYIDNTPIQNFMILRDKDGRIMTAYEKPIYNGKRDNDSRSYDCHPIHW
jgi:hypothetical protein